MAEDCERQALTSARSLYHLSVCTIATRFVSFKKYLPYLPESIYFDVYYQLYQDKKLCLLGSEFSNLEVFAKMLKVSNKRIFLMHTFQVLMDHGTKIGNILAINYDICCLGARKKPHARENIINLGLKLGSFLSDAGWYAESEKVLSACRELCIMESDNAESCCRILDCCHKLLHAQSAYCSFKGAAETYELALKIVKKLKEIGYNECSHAALFAGFSVLFFMRSEYDQAYEWSVAALKELKPLVPRRITVEVLRQAAKSCVIKREFQKAGLLIREALYLAREVFDRDHPKYCDVLIDYGFYLLNYDSITNSVSIYTAALVKRKDIFGKANLHTAIAHEDLAYALYIHEYHSGRFDQARENSERAIEIMEKLLPSEHLMLASAKRVKALILEEIALDNDQNQELSSFNKDLLHKSELLHLSALHLAQTAFGERNVQTAKHYGNLGRLYQSMRRYREAEDMHLKAIEIKEELLGPDDYEVGLSLGHLASLYNFHMERYRDAEQLYYRSIAINIKLFGQSYSGLEYDYRGLMRVYEQLRDFDQLMKYRDILNYWQELRKKYAQSEDSSIDSYQSPEPIENIKDVFFSM